MQFPEGLENTPLMLLSSVKLEVFFSNFVAFSDYPNFTWWA